WGVSEELVPETVYRALMTVNGLERGRTKARETEPVEPVPDDVIARTLVHLNSEVAGMVRVQRLTGMRPGEVFRLRPDQIDMTGTVWVFRPRQHKTAYRGKGRVVCIGPQAQEVLLGCLRVRCPLCGACDRPRRIGWQGDLCGPCADRMADEGMSGPWPVVAVPGDYLVFTPRDGARDRSLELRAKRKTKVQPSQQ